jgi:hypothetical protein
MSKEQRSNKEKKKPKQDKSVKALKQGTAYAQSKGGKK